MEEKAVSKAMLMLFLINIAIFAVNGQPAGPSFSSEETTLAADPAINKANPGQYFTINVTIANVSNLFSWQVRLQWSPNLLQANSKNITEGPFLKQGGFTLFAKAVFLNYIDIACTLVGAVPGVSGSGTLAAVTFKVLEPGSTTLDLSNTKLLDAHMQEIPYTAQDCLLYTTLPVAKYTFAPHPTEYPGHPIVNETVTFNATESYDPDDPYDPSPGGIVSYKWDFDDGNITTVTTPLITHSYAEAGEYTVVLTVTDDDGESYLVNHPIVGIWVPIYYHNIAVIDVTVTPNSVVSGSTVAIKVTAFNRGSNTETLNVTVYCNMQPVVTKLFDYWWYPPLPGAPPVYLKSLGPDTNATTIVLWDTTNVPEGTYTMCASVFLVKLIESKWESVPSLERDEDKYDNGFVGGTISVIEAPQKPISIYTDKDSYWPGHAMHLGLDITNSFDRAITVCIAVWLERPSSPIEVILHVHAVALSGGFTYSNPNYKTFVFPEMQAGFYTWHAVFLDPNTHAILVEDITIYTFMHEWYLA